MAKPDQLKTASVLAFERKLDPSDALFHAGCWDDRDNSAQWPAVTVMEKSVRGTISNRLKTKDESNSAKLDADVQKPNLQTVDVATLPNNTDTLKVRFTLRVTGGVGTPAACNNSDYQTRLLSTVQQYRDQTGFGELASRYAANLANGRFLWRNRVGAEQIDVRVSKFENGKPVKTWTFDALSHSLRNFDASSEFTELAEVIQTGLEGNAYVLLEITAYTRIGDGQEVYPSQELILDKGDKKGQKSKTLYSVGGVAAIHSQKIGNALRTIDTWYPDEANGLGPIAVEPYGSVTSQGKAYRQPKDKADFYSLLDAWVLKDKAPSSLGDQHFVIATLIRGGVFGKSDKD